MVAERGMLMAGHQLQDVINQLMLHSMVDDIIIPDKTELLDMAWKFAGNEQPIRIVDCTREQFLKIIEALASEISKIQKHNAQLKQQYENALKQR